MADRVEKVLHSRDISEYRTGGFGDSVNIGGRQEEKNEKRPRLSYRTSEEEKLRLLLCQDKN